MPIYAYVCSDCSKTWDEIRHTSDRDELATCTTCESPAHRKTATTFGGVQGNFGTPRRKGSTALKDGEQLNFDFDRKKE